VTFVSQHSVCRTVSLGMEKKRLLDQVLEVPEQGSPKPELTVGAALEQEQAEMEAESLLGAEDPHPKALDLLGRIPGDTDVPKAKETVPLEKPSVPALTHMTDGALHSVDEARVSEQTAPQTASAAQQGGDEGVVLTEITEIQAAPGAQPDGDEASFREPHDLLATPAAGQSHDEASVPGQTALHSTPGAQQTSHVLFLGQVNENILQNVPDTLQQDVLGQGVAHPTGTRTSGSDSGRSGSLERHDLPVSSLGPVAEPNVEHVANTPVTQQQQLERSRSPTAVRRRPAAAPHVRRRPAAAVAPGAALGCSKCRFSRGGCARCRGRLQA
jgi:hypothetical protein